MYLTMNEHLSCIFAPRKIVLYPKMREFRIGGKTVLHFFPPAITTNLCFVNIPVPDGKWCCKISCLIIRYSLYHMTLTYDLEMYTSNHFSKVVFVLKHDLCNLGIHLYMLRPHLRRGVLHSWVTLSECACPV